MKKIYYNGDILTMENSDYEAIYVEDGVIKKCGNYSEIKNLVCADTEFIDLQGKCLMPSFIDSHSHVVSLASTLKLVDLSKATSIAQIIQCFKNYIEENYDIKNINDLYFTGYQKLGFDETQVSYSLELSVSK